MRKVLMLVVCLCMVVQAFAQSQTVTGRVTDENGQPLVGASIVIKGTSTGGVTSADGSFSITVPARSKTLIISYQGYVSQEVAVSEKSFIIALKTDENRLSEVVVVAYGTQAKKAVTGAISSVTSDQIKNQQIVTIGQALQGTAPGVQVVNTTGQPGESPVIRIRGVGSVNASSDPLIVVDGIPFDGNLSAINPNDVETMNVLKDATATALYGSRAANGVILITTKTGKKNRDAQINAYYTYGVSDRAVKHYDYLSSEDFMKLTWEALRNYAQDNGISAAGKFASNNLIPQLAYNPYGTSGSPIDTSGNLVSGAKLLWNTDWNDAITRSTASRQNAGVSIAGASDKIRYFFSTDYLNQDGYIIKSNFQRINARANIDADVRKWFTVGVKTSISSSKQNFPDQSGSAYRNATQYPNLVASIYPLYKRDGSGALVLDGNGNPQYDFGTLVPGQDVNSDRPIANNTNAVAIQYLDNNEYKRYTTSLNTYGEVRFTDFLKFRSNFGIDRYTFDNTATNNSSYGDAAGIGRVTKERDLTTSYTWNNMLSFQKEFGDHSIGAMASMEAYKYRYEQLSASNTGIPFPSLSELNGATLESTSSYTNDNTILSYLGRVNYGYKGKYFVEGTLRRDGSSRFTNSKRWGTFYAVGGSWVVSQESFLQSVKAISFLKLRSSYGQTGNNSLPEYFPYLTQYSTGYNDLSNPGAILTAIGNPNISWEKQKLFNIGIDFGVLKDRLTGTIEWYNKNTSSLLFNKPLVPSSGISGVYENIGSMKNTGWEFNLNSRNIIHRNFTWNTNVNLATLKNRFTKLSQSEILTGNFQYKVGHSIYDFYIYDYAGVNPDNGDPLWYTDETDASGNPTGKRTTVNNTSSATRYYVGSALPKVTGGMSNTFTFYQNFDLSLLFNFALGGKILDNDYAGLTSNVVNFGQQMSVDELGRWQKAGDITNIPRLTYGQNDLTEPSTRFLVSSNYLRLRNVTLGYSLPKTVISGWDAIKSVRFFVQADNYWTWSKTRHGLDPEVNISGQTNQSSSIFKTISGGINIGF